MNGKELFLRLLYYASALFWYFCFAIIIYINGLLVAESYSKPDCYASNSKDDLNVYTSDATNVDKMHNVSANFRYVNYSGLIFFCCAILTMLYFQCRFSLDKYHRIKDAFFLWFLVLFLMWVNCFLMLLIFRLRHAGKVCSGDYLEPKRLIAHEESPYIHNNGLFLWYVMVAHGAFLFVMASGAASIVDA